MLAEGVELESNILHLCEFPTTSSVMIALPIYTYGGLIRGILV